MWYFFDAGGPMMYPLLICSILTVAYAIERSFHFLRAGKSPDAPQTIHDLIEKNEFDKALQVAEISPGPVSAVLEQGLLHAGNKKELIEEEITLKGTKELKRLNKHLHLIELISRIAPLMGLLERFSVWSTHSSSLPSQTALLIHQCLPVEYGRR